ncbi:MULTISPECIES: hypothetical protein [unclassified Streptomyces]|uniref:hypothetical protein n=1 Tax=Streptomyces sp. NPDC127129 TaxID=3345373 RepID=UPI00363B1556
MRAFHTTADARDLPQGPADAARAEQLRGVGSVTVEGRRSAEPGAAGAGGAQALVVPLRPQLVWNPEPDHAPFESPSDLGGR